VVDQSNQATAWIKEQQQQQQSPFHSLFHYSSADYLVAGEKNADAAVVAHSNVHMMITLFGLRRGLKPKRSHRRLNPAAAA
jgi:hypothetical protein